MLLKLQGKDKRRVIVIFFIMIFIVLLSLFNKVEKVQLTNRDGNSYEKAVVLDIIEDNIQEDGSRVGYQKVKLEILSGSLKGNIVEGTSFSGYLYGADCTKNMKVIVSLSKSGENITSICL